MGEKYDLLKSGLLGQVKILFLRKFKINNNWQKGLVKNIKTNRKIIIKMIE